ncbi:drug/metabolite transporter (DMT)-like permease [Clostridium tetanomorphum]|uniref:EamA family transporter n=1 Tax=Clostridium tetanomorphum TaxID=1553 RepID=A0A923J139_CLOTT|nr:EamA family transporter [Clostridium tetanomorphum]KAJ53128.1 transporter [Clostridium tetanomorphum DSM 665]MBC2396923.1 EamA family transporter [Clostridium tetanomorphum]MBP1863110.1 drug/metabolite transporter (DMT)-like permease [Clostridium tetanomorphum]NRS84219.1 drug/metabolite transporter (DMT)-like permease [Clostridium tetanomorphum]NRZ97432.1 drug/metabolite transporter (DMT)-like permease [Clostridium tetanomorphum]
MTDSKNKKGYLLALIAGASWGAMGIFVKNLGNMGLDSMTISSFRPTIAVLVYVLINLIKDPKAFKTDLKGLLLFAIYGVFALDGMFIASSYAVHYTGVATASVLLFINPIIVVVLSYFIFKESFTLKKFIALILALLGCCLVVKAYDSSAFKLNFVGIMWGIASGFAVALQNILGKIGLKKYSYKTHMIYSFLFGAIFLWFFVPPWTLVKSISNTSTLINILGLGVLATLVPNNAIVKSLQYIESGKASIVASVEPVVASVLAFIIFGEVFQIPQLFGIVLIMTSIILIQLKEKVCTKKAEEVKPLENTMENLNSSLTEEEPIKEELSICEKSKTTEHDKAFKEHNVAY